MKSFGCFRKTPYICSRIYIETNMSEEIKNIELQSDSVSEPAVAMAIENHTGMVSVHDEIDDLDWDRMPIFGPKTVEEAIARVDQAWADRNDPNKWIRIDDLHAELKKRHPWL